MLLSILHFHDLSIEQWHQILMLRSKVFVVEQACIYADPDLHDKIACHVYAINSQGELVGTARILPAKSRFEQLSIGRVVVKQQERNRGIAKEIMEKCHQYILWNFGDTEVHISAQEHLRSFYEKLGYHPVNKVYMEDGIPHIEMKCLLKK